MIKRLCLAWTLGALAAAALGQSPSPARMKAIWHAAAQRMVDQNNLWFEHGDYPRVVSLLKMMHDLWPDDYETATSLGWMLESIDREGEALAIYIEFRKDNPSQLGAALPEAMFYFQKKLYSKVPPILEPSLGRYGDPDSYRLLAHSYEKLNLLKDAARTWSSYLARAPGDQTAKMNLERVEKKLRAKPKPS